MGKYVGSLRTDPFKQMKFKPLILKNLIVECGISQRDLMKITGHSKAGINLTVNRGYIPARCPNFKELIQNFLLGMPPVLKWLKSKGYKVEDVWTQQGSELRMAQPAGLKQKIARLKIERPIVQGNPEEIINEAEAEMLNHEAMRHFKLFRSPFANDIRDITDIYMSDEHRYIEAAMLDAAKHAGFIAVIGEVGSGKSAIRKKVAGELSKDDNARVIYPRIIDKTRVTAMSLCDAIIMDLSDEKPKMRLEQKTRQVEKLLISRSKAGCHVCLIIEEAHDLSVRVLKLLKRFYEIEDGFKKALGIILIGQSELGSFFNEGDHYDMREVIRRCQVAYIKGLNGNLREYLTFKFKRINMDLKHVITDEAIEALSNRLKDKDHRGKLFSKAYPLTVNNYITRAMNMAYEMGESKVTESVIMAL